MTLAEAGEIFAYWETSPPAHLMLQAIAGMLGWRPVQAAAGAIAAAPPPGLTIVRGGDLGMPAPLGAEDLRSRNQVLAAGTHSDFS